MIQDDYVEVCGAVFDLASRLPDSRLASDTSSGGVFLSRLGKSQQPGSVHFVTSAWLYPTHSRQKFLIATVAVGNSSGSRLRFTTVLHAFTVDLPVFGIALRRP